MGGGARNDLACLRKHDFLHADDAEAFGNRSQQRHRHVGFDVVFVRARVTTRLMPALTIHPGMTKAAQCYQIGTGLRTILGTIGGTVRVPCQVQDERGVGWWEKG